MTYPMTYRHFTRASELARTTDEALLHLTRQAAASLAGLALITLQTHYDMAAFQLRGLLQQIEALPAADLPDHDQDCAVLLWRLQVFDQRCDTHFLTGLPNLTAWANRLLAHESTAHLRAPLVATHFISQQRHLGGLLTNPQRDQLWHPVCHAC
ncbi:hypothetical protein [Cypionkella sp.]|uniref:hypothetical protein n=1 Tax=Cypionkella sp. TaxID=2811411 RepID=UPI0026292BE2|nr:hypothetical protein [Cypionkella sp.]MDB5666394.1 hypothetical protein [Cypionkella sp.]